MTDEPLAASDLSGLLEDVKDRNAIIAHLVTDELEPLTDRQSRLLASIRGEVNGMGITYDRPT